MEWYPGLSKCLGLEYKVRDVGAKPSSQTKPFGSTTPLANPSRDHPHGGTLQLPEEKLGEVSPFQQKHLPPGEIWNIWAVWVISGRIKWLHCLRAGPGAVGCGIGQPRKKKKKMRSQLLYELSMDQSLTTAGSKMSLLASSHLLQTINSMK